MRSLGPDAPWADSAPGDSYRRWLRDYEADVSQSREDFVVHHHDKYGGRLPVWAAVELLGWGSVTYLYGYAPRGIQDSIAAACGLSAPQLSSWLKTLNLVRNTCAHHGRLFNRVHTFTPRLPTTGRHPDLDSAASLWNRTFGQLTLIQFLLDRLELGHTGVLPAVVRTFQTVTAVPLASFGAAKDCETASRLWGT